MRILVISDTHISNPNINFPKELNLEIEKSDYCFHAGDFIIYQVYKELSKRIKTYAVAGNMDDNTTSIKLPKKQVVKIGGFAFGLIHGRGTPNTLTQYIGYQFEKNYGQIDIFIFGHSHKPFNQEKQGKIYFNPGSVGDTIMASERTYGILKIESDKIKRSIKKIG